jgi:hypothetical protein
MKMFPDVSSFLLAVPGPGPSEHRRKAIAQPLLPVETLTGRAPFEARRHDNIGNTRCNIAA